MWVLGHVHTSPQIFVTEIFLFPLWRAYTVISADTAGTPRLYGATRVDASCIHMKTFADTISLNSCGRGLRHARGCYDWKVDLELVTTC